MTPASPPWQRCFAWRPRWIHFESPPLGLGRVVWLRWYERRVEYRVPAYDIERDLACRMWVIRISAAAAAAAVLLLLGLLLTGSTA